MTAAIDVETATRVAGSICAIGVARIGPGRVTTTRSWLVRPPGNRFEAFNTRIHGLGPADTRGARTFCEVWPAVLRFLAGADWVVAHNAASTERRHLIAAMRAAGVRPPPWRLACTLSASRVLLPRRKHHGLASLAQHYDIELEHHDPESDALACARLAHRLVSPRSLSDWAVDW